MGARRETRGQHVVHGRPTHVGGGEQQRGIEVALQREIGADARGRLVERHAVVDAERIDSDRGHVGQKLARADAEVDERHRLGGLDRPHRCEGRRRRRQHGTAVVGGSQGSRPRVEQLAGARARAHLQREEPPRHLSEPHRQVVPGGRVGVDEAARGEVVLRRTALDEVGGEGERRAGEADERDRLAALCGLLREHRGRASHGVGDLAASLLDECRIDAHEFGDLRGRAHGLREHRPAAGRDLDVEADELQRHHDVAEEHRGIHSVSPHRLQRDLACERRIEARVEHRSPAAQRPILGQRAPRLPHQPHRRDLGPSAAQRLDEPGRSCVVRDEGVRCRQEQEPSMGRAS